MTHHTTTATAQKPRDAGAPDPIAARAHEWFSADAERREKIGAETAELIRAQHG